MGKLILWKYFWSLTVHQLFNRKKKNLFPRSKISVRTDPILEGLFVQTGSGKLFPFEIFMEYMKYHANIFSFLFCLEYDVLIILVSVIKTDFQERKINQDNCINPTKGVGGYHLEYKE